MKMVKLWNSENRIEIVTKEEDAYMPKYYEKGTVCINNHYVYIPKYQTKMIKTVSQETEEKINKIDNEKKELRDKLNLLNQKKNSLLLTAFNKQEEGK